MDEHAGRQRRQDRVEQVVDIAARHRDVAGIDEQDVAGREPGKQLRVGRLNRSRDEADRQPVQARPGLGSMHRIEVAAPASRTARTAKRVEWPEPTSTIRRGGRSRTRV